MQEKKEAEIKIHKIIKEYITTTTMPIKGIEVQWGEDFEGNKVYAGIKIVIGE